MNEREYQITAVSRTAAPVGFAAVESKDKENRGGKFHKIEGRKQFRICGGVFKESHGKPKSEAPGSWDPGILEEAHMGRPGRLLVQPPSVPRNAPPTQLSLVLSLKNSNGLSAVTPAHQPTGMIDMQTMVPPPR